MKEENEKILFKDFPSLMKDIHYVECDDGWFPLIKEFLTKLQTLLEETNNAGNVRMSQIKEKFAGIRLYLENEVEDEKVVEEIYGLVNKFENHSFSVCEQCSYYGKIRKMGYYKTLCDKCYKEFK